MSNALALAGVMGAIVIASVPIILPALAFYAVAGQPALFKEAVWLWGIAALVNAALAILLWINL